MYCLSIANVLADHHGFWNKKDLAERKLNAKKVRFLAAKAEAHATGIVKQETNGDLERYQDRRGSPRCSW